MPHPTLSTLLLAFLPLLSACTATAPTPPAPLTQPPQSTLLQESLHLATQVTPPADQADLLAAITLAQVSLSDLPAARLTANSIDPRQPAHACALIYLAAAYTQSNNLPAAIALLPQLDADDQPIIHLLLAASLARQGNYPAAEALASHIQPPNIQDFALAAIALSHADAGNFPAALHSLSLISHPDIQTESTARVAALLASSGNPQAARRLLNQSLNHAATLWPPDSLHSTKLAVHAHLLANDIPAALDAISTLDAAPLYPTAASEDLSRLYLRSSLYSEIAAAQISAAQYADARASADHLLNDSEKISYNLSLAGTLASSNPYYARQLLHGAELIAATSTQSADAELLTHFARVRTQLSSPAQTTAWARSLPSPHQQARALLGILAATSSYHPPRAP